MGDVDVRRGNGDKLFSSLFHCWYYNPVAIFSLYGISVGEKKFLGVTVLFLMYMDKLVCSKSDINQEVIGSSINW